ncbi:MAG TPA: sialate O-acetylesterase [Verrucomicrobiae bacterium]|jgi:sialate O-acetylesterase
MKARVFLLIPAVLALSAAGAMADISLPPVFTDNMVLQREVLLPVWGRAMAGETVTVEFAGQKKTTTADAQGEWKLKLDPLAASAEPRTLRISGGQKIQFTNVLVGEVWLAAGQSNMEFPLARENSARTEIPAATNSQLRLLNFPFAGQYFYAKPFGAEETARQTPEKFFSGAWQACSPATATSFSAIAYYFSQELSKKLSVPVGIIHCAVGGSPTEAWISRAALESDPELCAIVHGNWLTNTALDDWCRQRGHENLDAASNAGLSLPGDELGPNHEFKPAFLWDAGPARFAPFAVRGVIWYQGESNSLEERRVRQHGKLFPLLVRNWRAAWDENFPFLFCQLSSIRTNSYKSASWPEFRDQQRRFLDTIPNTGMAVTSDLGLPNDVHPRDKRDVGHRLALWALAKTYGEKIEFSGPLPETIHRDGRKLIVQFTHSDGLKTGDGKSPRGFEIVGDDGMAQPAGTEINGRNVILSAEEIATPVAVRYGWQPFTDANLVNRDGLPASTFTLGITQ